LTGKLVRGFESLFLRHTSQRSRGVFNRNREPLSDREKRLLDLVETQTMIEIQKPVDLR
jgi:hypothetical protein